MITVLVKEIENTTLKSAELEELENFRQENAVLEVLLKEYVKKSIDYKELLEESLELLDKYQEEVEKLKLRANMWVDEVARLYKQHGDLDKAINAVGKEIMLYELSKNRKNCVEEE